MKQEKNELWWDVAWNPITGCTPASEGCVNCWAAAMAKRFWKGRKFNDIRTHPKRLFDPLRWRKPRRIFVCSMGDLFHEKALFDDITDVFDTMCSWRWPTKCPRCFLSEDRSGGEGDARFLEDPGHTFFVLTKRPGRIMPWLDWAGEHWRGDSPLNASAYEFWTLPEHIWLGVTCENQARADERIPTLLQIPAVNKWVSFEPLLGKINLKKYLTGHPVGVEYDYENTNESQTSRRKIDEISSNHLSNYENGKLGFSHVIIGCESINGRPGRFADGFVDAALALVAQCRAANVTVFVKQVPIGGRVSHNPEEWPKELRLRQSPETHKGGGGPLKPARRMAGKNE